MNLDDFLIIYFACGAPVGVYYFLQNRHKLNRQKLILKTFLTLIVWIPFALRYIGKTGFFKNRLSNNFDDTSFLDAGLQNKIQKVKRELEKALHETDPNISIYEIREIFDRYVSFSLFRQIDDRDTQIDEQIFQIAGHKNSKLAAICLQRRNRKMFLFHQTLARLDFLDLLAGKADLAAAAIEFASLLNDIEAKEAIEKIFDIKPQTGKESLVKDEEKALWKSEIYKPTFTKTISTRLKAMTATISSREKD